MARSSPFSVCNSPEMNVIAHIEDVTIYETAVTIHAMDVIACTTIVEVYIKAITVHADAVIDYMNPFDSTTTHIEKRVNPVYSL